MASTITLKNIVDNVHVDIGANNRNNHMRYKQWAIRCYQDLQFKYINQFSVANIVIDTNNVGALPSDYVRYIRIGVIIKGQVYTLSRNDNIEIKPSAGTPNTDLEDANKIAVGTWLSAPPKVYNLADYRLDLENDRIIFRGDANGVTVVLEYIGTDITENNTVPIQAREAVIAYIHWQRARFDKGTRSEREETRLIWLDELRKLHKFEQFFTLQEALDVLHSSAAQVPTRTIL